MRAFASTPVSPIPRIEHSHLGAFEACPIASTGWLFVWLLLPAAMGMIQGTANQVYAPAGQTNAPTGTLRMGPAYPPARRS